MSDTKTIRFEELKKGDVMATGHVVQGVFRVENKAGPYDHFVAVFQAGEGWSASVGTRDQQVNVMTGLPRFKRWLDSLSPNGVYAPSFIMDGLNKSFT